MTTWTPGELDRVGAAEEIRRIRAGGVEREVSFAQAPPDVQGDIDAAYHAKYDRYGPQIVGTVTGAHAAPVTLRLDPRDDS